MRHPLSLFVIALMTATTVVMGALIVSRVPLAQAQPQSPEVVAVQIYEKLPNFPRENQYRHRRKNEPATDNTLISRLIRYHTINQGRSPEFRLDWKITLTDYLGLNELLVPKEYPGAAFLKPNPMESDQAIIQELSRTDRDTLIQAIVDTFSPAELQQPLQPTPEPQPSLQEESAGQALPNRTTQDAKDLQLTSPSEAPQEIQKPTGDAKFLLINETP